MSACSLRRLRAVSVFEPVPDATALAAYCCSLYSFVETRLLT